MWPDEHIKGVIRAVVFRDSHHIKEEPVLTYPRMHVSRRGGDGEKREKLNFSNLIIGRSGSAAELPEQLVQQRLGIDGVAGSGGGRGGGGRRAGPKAANVQYDGGGATTEFDARSDLGKFADLGRTLRRSDGAQQRYRPHEYEYEQHGVDAVGQPGR